MSDDVAGAEAEEESKLSDKSDAWTDLGLTLPVFVLYHLGVVFLPVRNAADPVTTELRELANQSLLEYAGLTLAIGTAFVLVLYLLGRGHAFRGWRFGLVFAEALVYAAVMRTAGNWVLGSLPLAKTSAVDNAFSGAVMSLGAGFYEELMFRVLLFGVGTWVVKAIVGKGPTGIVLMLLWALASAVLFSAWHYVGPLADPWDLRTFVYRATCGFVLALIYATRGFAPAVWTHALYDIWAMVF
jgi:hypothetical protein